MTYDWRVDAYESWLLAIRLKREALIHTPHNASCVKQNPAVDSAVTCIDPDPQASHSEEPRGLQTEPLEGAA